MNINELANETGVTTRTIRYYVEQGLLPNPESGYPAQYTDDHLQRLALIRRLKEEYLPLDEIKTMLQGLNDAQIAALLDEHNAAPPPVKAANLLTSASDYINQVLGRGAVREQLKQTYAPPAPVVPAPATPTDRARQERAATPVPPASAAATPPPPAPAAAPPPTLAGRPAPAPAPGAAAPLRRAKLDSASSTAGTAREESQAAAAAFMPPAQAAAEQPSASASAPAASAQAVDTWQRIVLLPGIELHIAVNENRRFNRIVARLIEAAHRILAEEPEKAEDNL